MTNKLRTLFLISIPLFIAHGVEEIITGFYNIDSHPSFVFGYLSSLPTSEAVFILFQTMFWITLVVGYLLLLGGKWQMLMMLIPGIIFLYELHHLYKALSIRSYYPGLITAIPLYILGFFFWRELIKSYKSKKI